MWDKKSSKFVRKKKTGKNTTTDTILKNTKYKTNKQKKTVSISSVTNSKGQNIYANEVLKERGIEERLKKYHPSKFPRLMKTRKQPIQAKWSLIIRGKLHKLKSKPNWSKLNMQRNT